MLKEAGRDAEHGVNLYVRAGCPFCTRLLIFLAEAGLMNRVEVVVVDGNEQLLKSLAEMGRLQQSNSGEHEKVTFPAAEVARGVLEMETDRLIEWFSGAFGVKREQMYVLPFYENGVMKNQRKLVEHIGLEKALEIIYAPENKTEKE
uniref:Glutaredoxin domain-containing protein n=1 Tax=Erythrolobus madagascarensis TaxID=708628 RepID=A0A7S0T5W2_9RHOD|mmetsp:Transcript_1718/g.3691  ORF Transcript_1718/g.3691 Transcript_1718/m.3691 type:complete len:147 (+) Transcript_1718:49-489(+)